MFTTPILLITFNRPELTRRVLTAIMRQAPSNLYVFQDGARACNYEDMQKCTEVRRVVSELVADSCHLHTYYSEVNLGCGPGPAAGISWFFRNVEKGIIFEDDCFPSDSLFPFYEQMLNQYEGDLTVSMITGSNPYLKWRTRRSTYFFAKNGASPMGCWASWSRWWRNFDYSIADWEKPETKEMIQSYFDSNKYYDFYSSLYDSLCKSIQTHMWDYQWAFARYRCNSLCIVSSVNLISNIGFCDGATHSANPSNKFANLPIFECSSWTPPRRMRTDKVYDLFYFFKNNYQYKKPIILRVALKVLKLFYCR